MANETRTANVMIRLMPSLKTLAERAAKADTRSLSSLIEKALIEHLKANGYLKPPKSPVRRTALLPSETLDADEADRKPL